MINFLLYKKLRIIYYYYFFPFCLDLQGYYYCIYNYWKFILENKNLMLPMHTILSIILIILNYVIIYNVLLWFNYDKSKYILILY